MAEREITYRGTVYPWQCDHMGHMNVMWYVGKFDEATWQLLNMLGITPSYLRKHKRGMIAVEQRIEYKHELRRGDIVTARSRVIEMREKVILFQHEMRNEETGEVAATTSLTGVHMDTEARKSCPFPEEILQHGREKILDLNAPRNGDGAAYFARGVVCSRCLASPRLRRPLIERTGFMRFHQGKCQWHSS